MGNIKINEINNTVFGQYGRVLSGFELEPLIRVMETKLLPRDVTYVASDKQLESLEIYKIMSDSVYGGMDIQIGYCNGNNNKLNALEYHRSSEINIAVTDMILLLGKQQDIGTDYTYDTSNVEAFFIPKNTVVEIYATTLHYAPCGVGNEGFRCVVILPKGTNLEVDNILSVSEEDKLLMARNKWLIAHETANIAGAFNGLRGDNIEV